MKEFEEFLAALAGQSKANLANYRWRLRGLVSVPLGEWDRGLINDWYHGLEQHGYANASLAGFVQAVRSFTVWLVDQGYLGHDPATHLRRPRVSTARPRAASGRDIQAVASVAWSWVGSDLVHQRRAAAIFLVLLESACRRSAVRALRLAEWRRRRDVIGLVMVRSRSKGRGVVLRLGQSSVSAVCSYLALRSGRSPALFVSSVAPYGALHADTVSREVLRLCQAAGVRRFGPHAIRHFCGERIYRQFGPRVAAHVLGHADAATTAATATAFYHRPDEDLIASAAALLHL